MNLLHLLSPLELLLGALGALALGWAWAYLRQAWQINRRRRLLQPRLGSPATPGSR